MERGFKWYYAILLPIFGNAIIFQSHWFNALLTDDILSNGDIFATGIQNTFDTIGELNQEILQKIEEINDGDLPNGELYNKWLKKRFDKKQAKLIEGCAGVMKNTVDLLVINCADNIVNIIRARGVYANDVVEIMAYRSASAEERQQLTPPNYQEFINNVNELLAHLRGLHKNLSSILSRRGAHLSVLEGSVKQIDDIQMDEPKAGFSAVFAKLKAK